MASNTMQSSASGFFVDISSQFLDIARGVYASVEEFRERLRLFEQASGSFYSIRDSQRDRNGSVKRVKFICDRRGYTRPPSQGIRQRISNHTKCQAEIILRREGSIFKVDDFEMVHNHELLTTETRRWHNRERKLTENEVELLRPLVSSSSTAYQIRRYALEKFNKYLTGTDVTNLRHRLLQRRNDPGNLCFAVYLYFQPIFCSWKTNTTRMGKRVVCSMLPTILVCLCSVLQRC